MTNHNRPKYLKREKFSVSLPGWQRLLFAAIDPDSNSRALSRLVAEAIKRGALADVAPGLPPITDLTELATYLTGRPHMPAAPAPLYSPAPAPLYSPAPAPAPQPAQAKPAPYRALSDAELQQMRLEAEAAARDLAAR